MDRLPPVAPDAARVPVYNGYGCNMAIRMAPVAAHGLRFDTRLPLYGWLEDVDFSRQLRPHGAIRWSNACAAFIWARAPGAAMGCVWAIPRLPTRCICCANARCARIVRWPCSCETCWPIWRNPPAPNPDRPAGRLRGNLRALSDLMRGKLSLKRITEFE
ncbi:hypothetical protein [Gemmobacter sp. 24YEA27]|uniref:hypothetical protein n=1 Tax=Gemmobacter sp. 24YEA27 TaxID=3040672 RepID=UPI0024B399B5|nr:hypothetical protein [Gemmobacter sp. 24YEA27]